MRRLLLSLLLSMSCASAVLAESPGPVEMSSRVDRSRAALGETIVLTVDVAWPRDLDVHLPPADAVDLAPFEVRDAVMTPLPLSAGRKVMRYTIRLAAYETGRQTVPPLKVEYKAQDEASRTAESAPVEVEITRAATVPASAPSASAGKPEIRDIKPMDDVPTPLWMHVSAALAGLAAALLAAMAVRALVRRLRTRRAVPTTPHDVALAALDALVVLNLPARGLLKAHYDRLAQILRAYLAKRFELPVLEHTTAEVRAMMGEHGVDEGLRDEVCAVLEEADLVKFATMQCGAERALAQVEAVRSIVRNTLPPPPAEQGRVAPAQPRDVPVGGGVDGRER